MTRDPREALEDARRLIAQLLAQPVGDPRNAESIVTLETCLPYGFVAWAKKHRPAITASPREQKPVAWRWRDTDQISGNWIYDWNEPDSHSNRIIEPLYLSPPPAAGWDEAANRDLLALLKTIKAAHDNNLWSSNRVFIAERAATLIEALRREAPAPEGVAEKARWEVGKNGWDASDEITREDI